MQQPTFYGTRDVAAMLDRDEVTIREWTRRGIVRPQVSSGGARLFTEADIEKLAAFSATRRRWRRGRQGSAP